MAEVTCIGDIHGKVEAVEKALALPGLKIFVGDIIDSYDRSPLEHDKCFQLILDAIEAEVAECIPGNHELSYLLPKYHRCSGFDEDKAFIMQIHMDRITRLMKPFIWIENERILITHAGLHAQVAVALGITLENLPFVLEKAVENPKSPAHWIGKARGGAAPYGGIFWCDWYQEFQPIPGIRQVFGHTRLNSPFPEVDDLKQPQNVCIDCLDKALEFFDLEDLWSHQA